jgi:hypothetical protein
MMRFVLFCVLLATVACTHAVDRPQPVAVAAASTPAWVQEPDKPGYLGVVGAAAQQERGGRDAQYRIALMKARQALAQTVQTRVSSSLQISTEQGGGRVTRDVDAELRLSSGVQLQLDAARVIEEWSDPRTGTLYLWLVTPLIQVGQ